MGDEKKGKHYVNHLHVITEEINYSWKIAGFNEIPFLADHPVNSSSFVLDGKSSSVWQMLMDKRSRCKNSCTCSEYKVSRKYKDVEIQTDMDLEDFEIISGTSNMECGDERQCKNRVLGFKFNQVQEGFCWEVFKYHLELTVGDIKKTSKQRTQSGSPNFKSDYVYFYESELGGLDLDYVETVHIEAFIQYTFLNHETLEPPVADGDQFSEAIYHLFETEKYSDVLLIAGDVEIPAHRAILCARSYTMDASLQQHHHSDLSGVLQKVNLNVDENVARAMLSYIYGGGIPTELQLQQCKELCAAADKYQVTGLKSVVNKFFKKNLDLEVCFQCLSLNDSDFDLMNIPDDKLNRVLQKEMCKHKSE